jgi:hypothetical protein
MYNRAVELSSKKQLLLEGGASPHTPQYNTTTVVGFAPEGA